MSLVPWTWTDPFYRPKGSLVRWEDDDWSPWRNPDFRGLSRFPEYVERQISSLVKDAGAEVKYDEDKFQVNVDVQQFAPHEITVRTTGDDTIEVEAKHEEKKDQHGYVSRQFLRRYVLPKGHDVHRAVSRLSSDGVLTVTAPKVGQRVGESRTIPIQHSGPRRALEGILK